MNCIPHPDPNPSPLSRPRIDPFVYQESKRPPLRQATMLADPMQLQQLEDMSRIRASERHIQIDNLHLEIDFAVCVANMVEWGSISIESDFGSNFVKEICHGPIIPCVVCPCPFKIFDGVFGLDAWWLKALSYGLEQASCRVRRVGVGS